MKKILLPMIAILGLGTHAYASAPINTILPDAKATIYVGTGYGSPTNSQSSTSLEDQIYQYSLDGLAVASFAGATVDAKSTTIGAIAYSSDDSFSMPQMQPQL
jgi:hypothetical protein